MMMRTPSMRPLVAIKGLYFVATGIWHLVHVSSFKRVTEPKTGKWPFSGPAETTLSVPE